jgi:hypothetical protein
MPQRIRLARGSPRKFSGQLKTPIVVPALLGTNIDAILNDILNQRVEKLVLLLEHYNIETTDDPWVFLSLRLACANVPGFRVKRPGRGALRRWKGQETKVVAAIDQERAGREMSIPAAINNLKKKDPKRWGKFNEVRYYELRRREELQRQVFKALWKNIAEFS